MTHVIHHPSSSAQVQALVQHLEAWLMEQLLRHARVTLALSGGRSPIPLLQALSHQPWPWDRINVTLVDERMVPPDHADSNARLLREHLLIDAAAAARFVTLLDNDPVGLTPAALCEQAERRVRSLATQPWAVVLGMGTDGHTASLFAQAQGYEQACSSQAWIAWLDPRPHAPHARLSLTLHALRAASLRLLAIAGPDKQAMLQRALLKVAPDLPVSRLLHDTAHPTEIHLAP